METQIQKSIRMLWMNVTWRVLYCDQIELLAAHNRVTRNAVDKDGFEGWRTRGISEIVKALIRVEATARQSGVDFKESSIIISMLDNLNSINKWKELGKAFNDIVTYLRNLYKRYGSQEEGAARIVNRFTETNRLGWTKKQWDYYLNEATPLFRHMISLIKKQAPVADVMKDAKALRAMFNHSKENILRMGLGAVGELAYPGLERQFDDLIDMLSQIDGSDLNKQQSIILTNQYNKKILPRLDMMWRFARQEKPNA